MLTKLKIIILLVLLMLGGCGQAPDSDSSISRVKIYKHAMDGAPGSLDPAQAASIYANFIVVNLYDTLYRYKYLARPYQLQPNLAAAMPEISDDGLTLTIRIKQGVYFNDDPAFENATGREVKARDFVYSIKRHFDPDTRAQGAWLWQGRIEGLDRWKTDGSDYDAEVEGLRALDDYTIQIRLTRPFPQLVHTLTQGYAAIVPREAVEKYGQMLSSHPVGSGPFTLRSRDGVRAVLIKNSAFRQEPFDLAAEGFDPAREVNPDLQKLQGRIPPFIDRLEFEFVTEGAARWNAFASGELNFIKVPVSQFDSILSQRSPPTLKPEYAQSWAFEASPESGFIYTNFNMADEQLGYNPDPERNRRNHALRCAMVKAFDWKKTNEIFFYDIGRVFPGIIPPSVPEYDPHGDMSYITHDLEGAKELLRENGWNEDTLPTLDYGFPNGVTERQSFEQFRNFMMMAGYPADKIRPLIFATYGDYQRAYSQGKVSLINSSWTMDYPDTENLMQLYYGPNAAPGSNSASYSNPAYDRLYEISATMSESPERTAIYREMNQLLMDDCVGITGISRTLLFLWDKKFIMKPDRSFLGGYFLRFVDLAEPASATR
ncbi:MAG: ABC transporter substrate-binding protein [Lysobacterales bacterium]